MSLDGYLTYEDGVVNLSGSDLPGVLVSLSVACGVRYDKAKQDGLSGTAKTPLGWEDAAIILTLDLLSDESGDCYDKLAGLNRIFRGLDSGRNPKVLTVTGRHLRARGLDRVVFNNLDSDEDDQSDIVRVRLNFAEHVPAVVAVEKQVAAAGGAKATPAVTAKPAASAAIQADDVNPFADGFNSGLD